MFLGMGDIGKILGIIKTVAGVVQSVQTRKAFVVEREGRRLVMRQLCEAPLGGPAFQLGYNRLLVLSTVTFVPEGRLRLPKAMWERMPPGRYVARAVEPATLRVYAV